MHLFERCDLLVPHVLVELRQQNVCNDLEYQKLSANYGSYRNDLVPGWMHLAGVTYEPSDEQLYAVIRNGLCHSLTKLRQQSVAPATSYYPPPPPPQPTYNHFNAQLRNMSNGGAPAPMPPMSSSYAAATAVAARTPAPPPVETARSRATTYRDPAKTKVITDSNAFWADLRTYELEHTGENVHTTVLNGTLTAPLLHPADAFVMAKASAPTTDTSHYMYAVRYMQLQRFVFGGKTRADEFAALIRTLNKVLTTEENTPNQRYLLALMTAMEPLPKPIWEEMDRFITTRFNDLSLCGCMTDKANSDNDFAPVASCLSDIKSVLENPKSWPIAKLRMLVSYSTMQFFKDLVVLPRHPANIGYLQLGAFPTNQQKFATNDYLTALANKDNATETTFRDFMCQSVCVCYPMQAIFTNHVPIELLSERGTVLDPCMLCYSPDVQRSDDFVYTLCSALKDSSLTADVPTLLTTEIKRSLTARYGISMSPAQDIVMRPVDKLAFG